MNADRTSLFSFRVWRSPYGRGWYGSFHFGRWHLAHFPRSGAPQGWRIYRAEAL